LLFFHANLIIQINVSISLFLVQIWAFSDVYLNKLAKFLLMKKKKKLQNVDVVSLCFSVQPYLILSSILRDHWLIYYCKYRMHFKKKTIPFVGIWRVDTTFVNIYRKFIEKNILETPNENVINFAWITRNHRTRSSPVGF